MATTTESENNPFVEQEKKFEELRRAVDDNREVLLTGITGSGKSFAAFRLAIEIASKGKKVLWVTGEYEMLLHDVPRWLENFKEIASTIVVPQGKEKCECAPGCQHKDDDAWQPRNLKGLVTKQTIPKEYCVYRSLQNLAKKADIVFTHYSYYLSHMNDFADFQMLNVDEASEFMKIHFFVIAKFKGNVMSSNGLNLVENGLFLPMKALRQLKALDRMYAYDIEELRVEDGLFSCLQRLQIMLQYCVDSATIGAESLDNRRKENERELSTLSPSDLIDEYAYSLRSQAFLMLERNVDFLNHVNESKLLRQAFSKLEAKDFVSLPNDLKAATTKLWEVASRASKLIIRFVGPSESDPEGYTEISLVDDLQDYSEKFEKVLYISATPPIHFKKSIPVVTMDNTTIHPSILFLRFDNERKVKELIHTLSTQYNILGITTNSKKNLEELKSAFGGHCLEEYDTLDVLVDELKKEKGHLNYLYFGSRYHKGVNSLEIFDAVVVFHWISKHDPIVDSNPEMIEKKSSDELYQALGRVPRPDENGRVRKKAIIFINNQKYKNERAFELMKGIFKTSKFDNELILEKTIEKVKRWSEAYTFREEDSKILEFDLKVTERKNKKNGKTYPAMQGSIPVEIPAEVLAKNKGRSIKCRFDPQKWELLPPN